MSTVVVRHYLYGPGQTGVPRRRCFVTLHGPGGWLSTGTGEIIDSAVAESDDSGLVAVTVTPNVEISGTGTYYMFRVHGTDVARAFVAPVSGSPVQLINCLVDPATLNPISPALPSLYLARTELGVANGVASLGSDGKVPAAQLPSGSGGSAPDATSTVKGILKLTNDLGGTADLPTVPGLANKQPLDADLTAIAALTPSDNDLLQRKAGAWTNRTPSQVKTDLALVKGDVGLGSVDNTSDANKPVSTAQQTAINAARAIVTNPMSRYGIVAAPGDLASFMDAGGFSAQMVVVRMLIPAGVSFSRMCMPIRTAGTFTPGSGKPNCLAWWDDNGVLQQTTPDDDTMWSTADWYVANLPSTTAAQAVDRYVYGGFQISGVSGAAQYVLSRANDSGGVPFSHAPGATKRFCAYTGSVATIGNIDPNTIGTLTSFMPFVGFMP